MPWRPLPGRIGSSNIESLIYSKILGCWPVQHLSTLAVTLASPYSLPRTSLDQIYQVGTCTAAFPLAMLSAEVLLLVRTFLLFSRMLRRPLVVSDVVLPAVQDHPVVDFEVQGYVFQLKTRFILLNLLKNGDHDIYHLIYLAVPSLRCDASL